MKQTIYTLFILLMATAAISSSYAQPSGTQADSAYYCPPCGDCDTLAFNEPGKCPHCGMLLVKQNKKDHLTNNTKTMTVLFYLQNGVEVLDFAGPLEVFSYAGFKVATVSKTKSPIISQGVLKIIPDYSVDDAPSADILAFFGGNAGSASNDSTVINWLKKQPVPEYYFSVCTGAFILGKAGLLDHLTVTTFHQSIEGLKKAVPKAQVLSNVRFVDNGRVITTAGISAGIDGALHLVAKIKGEDAAKQAAYYMEYDKWVPGQGLVMQK